MEDTKTNQAAARLPAGNPEENRQPGGGGTIPEKGFLVGPSQFDSFDETQPARGLSGMLTRRQARRLQKHGARLREAQEKAQNEPVAVGVTTTAKTRTDKQAGKTNTVAAPTARPENVYLEYDTGGQNDSWGGAGAGIYAAEAVDETWGAKKADTKTKKSGMVNWLANLKKQREVRPKLNRKRREELLHFSRQLSAFFDAGVPIVAALETLAGEARRKDFKKTLQNIADQVNRGETFSAAVTSHPKVFPPFFLGVVASAELTGDLSAALEHVGEYLERDSETRSKISSAMTYPCIVAGLAVVVVGMMATVVLPKFSEFFESMDAPMPKATRVMMGSADVAKQYWWVGLAAAWVIVALLVVITRSRQGRAKLQTLTLHLPLIGKLLQAALAERFCRLFGSLLDAGIPVTAALDATGSGMDHALWEQTLGNSKKELMRGKNLSEALCDNKLMPPVAVQMIKTGEETGTLPKQLARACTYYSRELDSKIKRFTGLLEPLVIIGVGLMVGAIALSLVSAMYGVYQSMGAGI